MVRRLGCAISGAAVLFLAVACSGKDPTNPGEKIGTFNVTAALTSTTCGQAPNPWTFDMRLNHDGATLFWLQGGLPESGTIDSNGRTQMTSSFSDEVRAADDTKKIAACDIQRTDAATLVLSDAAGKAAVDPADTKTFTGILSYTFAPTDGSACGDQLTSVGGGYDALPCSVTYSLNGTMASATN